jgi:outer membrane protein OmpA-like peptidoglycan-associated protein
MTGFGAFAADGGAKDGGRERGMAQSLRWFWGLAPLALLWGVGNLVLGDPIQQDVGRRALATAATAAGDAPGAMAVVARVVGRDVTISGEALSNDGAARAMTGLRGEYGVRRALGGLSQVVAQRPYGWSATRLGEVVTLGGFVPDETTAKANIAAATLPGLRVDDRQALAFGAPPGFAGMTKALLAELPKLAAGKIALDDARFCIEGRAETPDAFLALKTAVSGLSQQGFQPVDCALEPPVVAPYRWSAERGPAGGVSVTGFYPSDTQRAQILATLRRSFPEPARIEDLTKPALGAPAAFLERVTRAIGELARLRDGKVELTGDSYLIAGQGPADFEACQALRLQIAQLDGPNSVAQASIACPPAPPPLPAMPALPEIPPLSLPAAPSPAASAPPAVASVAPPPAAPPPPARQPEPATPSPPPLAVTIEPPVLPPAPPPPVPPPVPLRWQAEKGDRALAITGLVRDEAARAALRAIAARQAGARRLDDSLSVSVNLASEPDYAVATAFALDLLGRLTRGSVSIAARDLSIAGEVADEAAWRAISVALAATPLPGGLVLRAAPASIVIRPYALTISVDRSGVSLAGHLPDEAAREALRALVEASPLRGKVADATTLLPSAPPGFVAAARLALVNLLRLDLGSATVGDTGVVLRGLTCRDLIRSEVETSAASHAGGLRVEALIGLRQTGCVIDPPNTCQNDLDMLTKRNTVLFGQGTSVVTLDATTERVVGEAQAILNQCPDARIIIEGHANNDGDGRFDNLDLSQRRALRVREELVRRGIDAGRLAVEGFGTARPLVPHGAADARVLNRRVQFTVAK